jgi:hypothetical protein
MIVLLIVLFSIWFILRGYRDWKRKNEADSADERELAALFGLRSKRYT